MLGWGQVPLAWKCLKPEELDTQWLRQASACSNAAGQGCRSLQAFQQWS